MYLDEEEAEVELDDPIEEEGCDCGYFCFDCLGMTWYDFM